MSRSIEYENRDRVFNDDVRNHPGWCRLDDDIWSHRYRRCLDDDGSDSGRSDLGNLPVGVGREYGAGTELRRPGLDV
jgi:hypothetical protein